MCTIYVFGQYNNWAPLIWCQYMYTYRAACVGLMVYIQVYHYGVSVSIIYRSLSVICMSKIKIINHIFLMIYT